MRLLFFLTSLAIGWLGCQQQQEPVQGSTFYYYPKPNIYYDIEQKQYYLLSPNQIEWQKRTDLLPEQLATLGKKVIIDTPGIPVYKNNAHHRLVYGAALYTSQAEMQRKFIEDSLSSLPKRDTLKRDEVVKEEKRRSKVGRFFDNLFGKKKKEKEPKGD